LGYAIMIAAYIVAMTGLILLVARLIAGYEVPDPTHALLLMLLEGVLLLTLSLFGSTLMPTLANGVVVFTLLGLAWLAGVIEFVGRLLQNASDPTGSSAMVNVGTAVSLLLPSDALWRGASYYLESPSLLAMLGAARGGIPFFSATPPASALIVWSLGYVLVVLGGAVLAFRSRDL
jgi:ABC-type transport system involved in multi-copper enzyme maturation permease subunit